VPAGKLDQVSQNALNFPSWLVTRVAFRRNTSMDYKYKSHSIVITTWASLDRNGYTPEFRITKKAPKLFQKEKLNNASRTKEEPGNFALDLAK
jgi:hypothetical protein